MAKKLKRHRFKWADAKLSSFSEKRVYTAEEIADRLKCSVGFVLDLRRRKDLLDSGKSGGSYVFSGAEVMDLIRFQQGISEPLKISLPLPKDEPEATWVGHKDGIGVPEHRLRAMLRLSNAQVAELTYVCGAGPGFLVTWQYGPPQFFDTRDEADRWVDRRVEEELNEMKKPVEELPF